MVNRGSNASRDEIKSGLAGPLFMRANVQMNHGVAVIIVMKPEVSHPIDIHSTAVIHTPTPKTAHASLLIAGLAVFLFSGVAMSGVAILQWFQGSTEPAGEIFAQGRLSAATSAPPGTDQAPAKSKCEECGVVDSNRRIASMGNSPVFYEITLRMSDGSIRVLNDAKPAALHPGEHIILIGGFIPSGR
ncbi:MAG: hypothetical protein NT159_05610 [Proteobacteria bacterium]|nr:hypothetical protein [Pseudomonadota bacterium]